ncbi:MAG TPA: HAD-IA family hydrolase [Thermodesulfovibrionales bacterium]|jgi:phosphoglycolate phosphatase|nr:HAD-IA family hydrolase [Thermodesulfovibrionales bacterium]
MPFKLIIFDLDGTLIDSSRDITEALNYALEPYSSRRVTVQETVNLVGEGLTRLIEKITGYENASSRPAIMKRFLQHYTEHITDHTRAYPGVAETLERLDPYRKAVISNKKEGLSRMVLERLGLLKYFEVVIGSDSVAERKPSPLPIIKVLTEFGLQPGDAVMVGDSNYDVDAGRSAGVATVAVTYGYRPLEVIRHADHLIDRFEDLIPLLEKMTTGS